jgi:RNA polymerase sigma-70 factor (ECF subfamily)
MDAVSELQLWHQSKNGDGRAFGSLYDLHQPRLYRAALRTAVTRTDAEDLVAATFLELWRRRETVRIVEGSLLPWMLVTLHNLGRNAVRAAARHRRFLATLPKPSTADVLLEEVEVLQAERDAMRILRSMPEADATILALTAIEGLTVGEAAAALGISPESARARLSRARRRARLQLAPEGITS